MSGLFDILEANVARHVEGEDYAALGALLEDIIEKELKKDKHYTLVTDIIAGLLPNAGAPYYYDVIFKGMEFVKDNVDFDSDNSDNDNDDDDDSDNSDLGETVFEQAVELLGSAPDAERLKKVAQWIVDNSDSTEIDEEAVDAVLDNLDIAGTYNERRDLIQWAYTKTHEDDTEERAIDAAIESLELASTTQQVRDGVTWIIAKTQGEGRTQELAHAFSRFVKLFPRIAAEIMESEEEENETVAEKLTELAATSSSLPVRLGIGGWLYESATPNSDAETQIITKLLNEIDAAPGLKDKMNVAGQMPADNKPGNKLKIAVASALLGTIIGEDMATELPANKVAALLSVANDFSPVSPFMPNIFNACAKLIDRAEGIDNKLILADEIFAKAPFESALKKIVFEQLLKTHVPTDVDMFKIAAWINGRAMPESKPAQRMFAAVAEAMCQSTDVDDRFNKANWLYTNVALDSPVKTKIFDMMVDIFDNAEDLNLKLRAARWVCDRVPDASRPAERVLSRVMNLAHLETDLDAKLKLALWVEDRAPLDSPLFKRANATLIELGFRQPDSALTPVAREDVAGVDASEVPVGPALG